jgi:hypothetical protein
MAPPSDLRNTRPSLYEHQEMNCCTMYVRSPVKSLQRSWKRR